MFIKKIKIKNYRSFDDFSMEFKEGLNVIIGSNNSGKTNLLKAICLLTEPSVTVDDFNKNNISKLFSTDYKNQSPEIVLEYEIHHLIDENNTDDESIVKLISFLGLDKIEEQKNTEEEKITKYNIIANVRMRYYLDSKYIETYKKTVANADTFKKYITGLEILLEHYKWTFTNGMTSLEAKKEDVINIFKIDFIEAERTAASIYKKTTKEINNFIKDKQNIESLQKMKDEIADIVKTQMKAFNLFV